MAVPMFDAVAGRLGRIVLALIAAFLAGAALLSPPHLILLLNGLALSVSAGVSTAYLPVASSALGRRTPSRGDVLGAGIFFAGLSDMALRLESIAARDFGLPALFNADTAAVPIFIGLMALVAFLWGPHAEHGRVPREKWRLAGLLVASGVAIAFAAGATRHGLTPGPAMRLE